MNSRWRKLLGGRATAVIETDQRVVHLLDSLDDLAELIIPPVPQDTLPYFNQLTLEAWRIGLISTQELDLLYRTLQPHLAPLEAAIIH